MASQEINFDEFPEDDGVLNMPSLPVIDKNAIVDLKSARTLLDAFPKEESPITKLGLIGWEKYQTHTLTSLLTHEVMLLIGAHGEGKCVAASEYLTLADGQRVQACDLIGREFTLLTVCKDGIGPVAARAEYNAHEDVYEIITESGRRITRNAAHPLWAADKISKSGSNPKITSLGWKGIASILPGQLVAVAETLPFVGTATMPTEEIKILAYLIGNGGITTGTVISQGNGPQLEEIKICVDALGCTLNYNSGVDYRITSKDTSRNEGCNPVLNLLRKHDLAGKGAGDKKIPASIFTLCKEDLKLFLSRLYSTDGWASVAKTNRGSEIGYCSKSLQLCKDIQELLLRFGVNGRIKLTGNKLAWVVQIRTSEDKIRFCEQIGIFGKEIAVHAVLLDSKDEQSNSRRMKWRHNGLQEGLRWERVESITMVGQEDTVAIEVPETNTFLTTFWEHNTFFSYTIAKALGLSFASYNIANTGFEDVLGIPDPYMMMNESKRTPGKLDVIKTPQTIWGKDFVLLQEMSRSLPEMLAKWMDFLAKPHAIMGQETGVQFIMADMNPPQGIDVGGKIIRYAGTEPLDPAILDRFGFFLTALQTAKLPKEHVYGMFNNHVGAFLREQDLWDRRQVRLGGKNLPNSLVAPPQEDWVNRGSTAEFIDGAHCLQAILFLAKDRFRNVVTRWSDSVNEYVYMLANSLVGNGCLYSGRLMNRTVMTILGAYSVEMARRNISLDDFGEAKEKGQPLSEIIAWDLLPKLLPMEQGVGQPTLAQLQTCHTNAMQYLKDRHNPVYAIQLEPDPIKKLGYIVDNKLNSGSARLAVESITKILQSSTDKPDKNIIRLACGISAMLLLNGNGIDIKEPATWVTLIERFQPWLRGMDTQVEIKATPAEIVSIFSADNSPEEVWARKIALREAQNQSMALTKSSFEALTIENRMVIDEAINYFRKITKK